MAHTAPTSQDPQAITAAKTTWEAFFKFAGIFTAIVVALLAVLGVTLL